MFIVVHIAHHDVLALLLQHPTANDKMTTITKTKIIVLMLDTIHNANSFDNNNNISIIKYKQECSKLFPKKILYSYIVSYMEIKIVVHGYAKY